MNRANKLMMVAVTITAVFNAAEAFAQGFTPAYANQDLLLNFRQQPTAGAAGLNDVTFDLGQVTSFVATYGNSTVQINSGAFANAYDPSLLTSAAGGNFGNLNNLHFGVVAANATAAVYDMWATAVRGANTDNSVADSTAWDRKRANNQSSAAQAITSVGNNAQSFGTTLSATAIKSLDASGYNNISGGGVYATYFSGSTEGFTGQAFGANDVVRLDLYSVVHTASTTIAGGAQYLGFFELQGDGDLFWVGKGFASAVVPEPTTYGLLAGLGMLALTTRRQLRQLRQA